MFFDFYYSQITNYVKCIFVFNLKSTSSNFDSFTQEQDEDEVEAHHDHVICQSFLALSTQLFKSSKDKVFLTSPRLTSQPSQIFQLTTNTCFFKMKIRVEIIIAIQTSKRYPTHTPKNKQAKFFQNFLCRYLFVN